MDTEGKSKVDANYSTNAEAAIRAASPFDLAGAKVLGRELGKSYRSIIAKCKSMNLDYIVQVPALKRPTQATKAQIVKHISDLTERNFFGLEKATMSALVSLLDYVATQVAQSDPAD